MAHAIVNLPWFVVVLVVCTLCSMLCHVSAIARRRPPGMDNNLVLSIEIVLTIIVIAHYME